MTSIELNNVSVSFPVYSAGSRSLKNVVISATTGGRIGNQSNHVIVQALDNVSLKFEHGDRVALSVTMAPARRRCCASSPAFSSRLPARSGSTARSPRCSISRSGSIRTAPGYENIILRGLYLGLSRAQTMTRLDEVVAFTELGSFLELPVRTYSLGMQARLSFAMATCIDPEILLLDEGIAAGDAGFLDKANERLNSFISRTGILVFASHSNELLRRSSATRQF